MIKDPFVHERALPGVVQDICARRGIAYRAFSDDWVLRLEYGGVVRWVIGNNFDLNTSAAAEIAKDKVATYLALDAEGIPAVEHYLLRAAPHDPQQWQFDAGQLPDGPVVLKPLDGSGGRGVARYESLHEALNAARHSMEPALTISPYYDLTDEYRLIMLDGKLQLAFVKTQPVVRNGLTLFNLGHGAIPDDITDADLLDALRGIAEQAVRAMSLRLAAVDVVRSRDGRLRVLEVNDGIRLEHYMQQSGEYKNRAVVVFDAIVTAMFD